MDPAAEPRPKPAFHRLFLLTLAAVAVVPVAYLVLGPMLAHPRLPTAFEHTVRLAVPAWAAAAAWTRARMSRPRTAAVLLGAYCLVWMLGQAVRAYDEIVADAAVRFPSLADLGYLGAVPFAVAAAILLPGRTLAISSVRAALDGALIALSMFFLVWSLIIGPLHRALGGWEAAFAVAYPAADVALLASLAIALPRIPRRARSGVALVFLGLTAIALADVVYAHLALTGQYATGSVVDSGWVAGFLLIAAGCWRATASPRGARSEVDTAAARRTALLVPPVFVILMMAVGLWHVATDGFLGPVRSGIAGTAFALLVARQVVTALESERRGSMLSYRSTHDGLTGLLNRQALRARLESVLDSAGRTPVLLVIDIDNFKALNDRLGHSGGDKVLTLVGARLAQAVRPGDHSARLGGDEFAVLLTELEQPREAIRVAERITGSLSRPLEVGGTRRSLSVSIGIAIGEEEGDGAETLLRNADLAMYTAKRKGKNRYALYEQSMHADVVERLTLTEQLEQALDEEQFVAEYQPKLSLRDGAIVGAEALVRWQHPERGLLRPGAFLPVAEESGLVNRIGSWVLGTACATTARLRSEGLVTRRFHICVNVASSQVADPAFVREVEAVLARTGLPASMLVLELTESALIDTASALPTLQQLASLGVRLAIDDFGTGYSSLSYLQRFPVHILKVDRSFVSEIDQGVENEAMTRAILALARTMNLLTIAEGIERTSQLDKLRELGCDEGQGYHFAESLAEQDFIRLLVDAEQIGAAAGPVIPNA